MKAAASSVAIDTVLFDADRVIQRSTVDWRSSLAALLSESTPIEAFIVDFRRSVAPCLVGRLELHCALAEVLRRWGSTIQPSSLLKLWAQFETDSAVMRLIQAMRHQGVACHLASNQVAYRKAIMQEDRRYKDLFDRTFYSCDVGTAKPDPRFFEYILRATARRAPSLLFIDDRRENIVVARDLGLRAEQYALDQGADRLQEILSAYGLDTTGEPHPALTEPESPRPRA